MKVRLKQVTDNVANGQVLFQFHEGPIKTKKFITITIVFRKFQFHEGPIKTKSTAVFSSSLSVSIP